MQALKTLFIAIGFLSPFYAHGENFDVSTYVNNALAEFRVQASKVMEHDECNVIMLNNDTPKKREIRRALYTLTRERRPLNMMGPHLSGDHVTRDILTYLSDEFVRLEEYAIIHELTNGSVSYYVHDAADLNGRAYRLIRIIDDYSPFVARSADAQRALFYFVEAIATDDVMRAIDAHDDLFHELQVTLGHLRHSNRPLYDLIHDRLMSVNVNHRATAG